MSLTPEMMPAWELLPIVKEQAARIAQLEAALAMFVCDCTVSERCPVPDNCRNFQARRTMEAKCSFS